LTTFNFRSTWVYPTNHILHLAAGGPVGFCLTVAVLVVAAAPPLMAQTASCPAVAASEPSAAVTAYGEGRYGDAEEEYTHALEQQPHDVAAAAALAHILLHEGKIAQAADRVTAGLTENPHSAAMLTAQAEVQLRQGQPWLALESLDAAAAIDRCYARIHLMRSRVLRIDSMYASERAEIQSAYEIDPNDLDIQNAWRTIVSPAHEIEGISQALSTMKDLDAETRQKSEASMNSMLPLLSENSQTCKIEPGTQSVSLRLLPTMEDGKHLDGYRLEVLLPKTMAKLQVDTATSGLFISRALADANGLQQAANDPPGTVRVDSVHIGPLEFRDCLVGVNEAGFPAKGDGVIGTDIFASYLVTMNTRDARFTLDPLPPQTGVLPGDRPKAPELAGYMPVYHRRHYLIVPVVLNNRTRKLFVLDSGMRLSTMTTEAAHSISNIKTNFTNPLQIASGPPARVYRDNFDFEFANLSLPHQNRVVEWDLSVINHNTGLEIAGLLGFDMLHSLNMHLDYRDGLVKFEPTTTEASPAKGIMTASAAPAKDAEQSACPEFEKRDWPVDSTIEARVTQLLDSAHLKPGREIYAKVVYGLTYPGCLLAKDANLYGHVTAADSTKSSSTAQLGIVFDHADCQGQGKQALPLRVIGLVAPADTGSMLHDALPTEVAGVRSINAPLAGSTGRDDNLSPGGPPHTVHPGIVVRMPKVKLEPEGGPVCSARISSSEHSVQLAPGAELIMTVQKMTP
jgi:Tfp pilus assembly protein PilF